MARFKSHLKLDTEDRDASLNLGAGSASTRSQPATTDAATPALSPDPEAATPATPFSEPPSATPFDAEPDPVSDPDAGAPVNSDPTPDESATPADTPEPPADTPEPAAAQPVPRSTLAGRVWIGLIAAVVLLVLVIIFIAENTRSVSINFLGAHGHISEGLALLIAIVIGVAITLLVGSARIVQLTLELRRHRRKLSDLS